MGTSLLPWDVSLNRKQRMVLGPVVGSKQVVSSGLFLEHIYNFNYGIYLSKRRKRRDVPEGKCSLTGQLSTCKVALPPFLVKRTRWYLPSLMVVLVSFTLMSTVPMLKVTPTLPCS